MNRSEAGQGVVDSTLVAFIFWTIVLPLLNLFPAGDLARQYLCNSWADILEFFNISLDVCIWG